mmetsp:Transcript_58687/g.132830  ORF Transcript_58687/g.132830 Transcript_58687/m.132830 type:complete len:291 (-) Transcript_58687:268-1140(-)
MCSLLSSLSVASVSESLSSVSSPIAVSSSCLARSSGVRPSSSSVASAASNSCLAWPVECAAPHRAVTPDRFPWKHAQCNAVQPSSSLTQRSAPRLRILFTQEPTSPTPAATTMSAVASDSDLVFTFSGVSAAIRGPYWTFFPLSHVSWIKCASSTGPEGTPAPASSGSISLAFDSEESAASFADLDASFALEAPVLASTLALPLDVSTLGSSSTSSSSGGRSSPSKIPEYGRPNACIRTTAESMKASGDMTACMRIACFMLNLKWSTTVKIRPRTNCAPTEAKLFISNAA